MANVIITAHTANGAHNYITTPPNGVSAQEFLKLQKKKISSAIDNKSGIVPITDATHGEMLLNVLAYHAITFTIA